MSQKVRIKTGFAAGLEGEAWNNGVGWSVTITYPEGFVYDLKDDIEDLSGVTETLFYSTRELEFFDSAE